MKMEFLFQSKITDTRKTETKHPRRIRHVTETRTSNHRVAPWAQHATAWRSETHPRAQNHTKGSAAGNT